MTPNHHRTFVLFPLLLLLLLLFHLFFHTSADSENTNTQPTEVPGQALGNTVAPSSPTGTDQNTSDTPQQHHSNATSLDYYSDVAVNESEVWDNNLTTTAATTTAAAAATTTTASPADGKEEGNLVLGDFCLCDLKIAACDVNCCCDGDCSDADRMVFSHCLPRPSPTPDSRYCVQQDILYRTFTEFKVEQRQHSLTCIVTDNLPQRTSHTPVQGARTLQDFRKLQEGQPQPSFSWPQQQQWQEEEKEGVSAEELGTSAYTAGDPVVAYDSDGMLGTVGLPTSVISRECEALQPVLFLQDAQTSCTRVLPPHSILQECHRNAYLSAMSYLSFVVLAGPGSTNENTTSTEEPETTAPPSTTTTITTTNTTHIQPTEPAPQTSPSTTQQTLVHVTPFLCQMDADGDKMCTKTNAGDVPSPTYTNGGCTNITREVKYVFIHNGTFGLVEVRAEVQLGTVVAQGSPVVQRFAVRFVWAEPLGEEVFERSGRPGYVLGKPLLMGRLVENVTQEGEVRSAITLESDPAQWLTILTPGVGGHCTGRSQVTFGINMRSGCTLQLTRDDLRNCEALKSRILTLLLGPHLSDPAALRVGTFGDASVENTADWVPVLVPEEPRSGAGTVSGRSGSPLQCQNLLLSLHLEVAYSLQGALKNPQAKVVGVVLRPGTPQSLGVVCSSCAQSHAFPIELASSVGFVEVISPALAAYAKAPALDVKLPCDFFYPFLPSCGCGCGFSMWARVLWAVGLLWGSLCCARV